MASVKPKVRCRECRNVVRSNGMLQPEPLCGKCLTTPYEIRQREIHGCLSLAFILTPEEKDLELKRQEKNKHRKYMNARSSTVHRNLFTIVTPPTPSSTTPTAVKPASDPEGKGSLSGDCP